MLALPQTSSLKVLLLCAEILPSRILVTAMATRTQNTEKRLTSVPRWQLHEKNELEHTAISSTNMISSQLHPALSNHSNFLFDYFLIVVKTVLNEFKTLFSVTQVPGQMVHSRIPFHVQ